MCGLNLNNLNIEMWRLPETVWIKERLEEFSVVLAMSGELMGNKLTEEELDRCQARFLMNLFMKREEKEHFLSQLETDKT